MPTFFYSIEIWLRKLFGMGPKRKIVNIYYIEASDSWLIRPTTCLPSMIYAESLNNEITLGAHESETSIIHTISRLIESCHYSNLHNDTDALKGWKKFVEAHHLIFGTIKKSSICFEPWIRKQTGHKNAHYVPSPDNQMICAPIAEMDKAFSALCRAKEIAIKMSR